MHVERFGTPVRVPSHAIKDNTPILFHYVSFDLICMQFIVLHRLKFVIVRLFPIIINIVETNLLHEGRIVDKVIRLKKETRLVEAIHTFVSRMCQMSLWQFPAASYIPASSIDRWRVLGCHQLSNLV